MYRKKSARLLVFLLFFILLSGQFVEALPEPTSEFYCNDFANVLSQSTRTDIIQKAEQLEQDTGIQLVVSTVANMGGADIESYSLEMAREYGIGQKDADNGVLILFALEEREIRVEVGYGLEGVLNDAKVGRMIDQYALDYLRNNDYDEGIYALFLGLLNELGGEGGQPAEEGFPLEIFLPLGLLAFIVIMNIIFHNPWGGSGMFGGRRPPTFWGGFHGGGSFRGGNFGGGGSFGGGGASRKF